MSDQGLADLFKAHKASKAHIVRNRNGRSKGFGFVEFDAEADQKAGLQAAEKLSVEGRELIVKIALTGPEPSASSEGGSGGNNAAASSSSPAASSSPAPSKDASTSSSAAAAVPSSPAPTPAASSPAPSKDASTSAKSDDATKS